jgi:anti-anti-sigma regulatory factor
MNTPKGFSAQVKSIGTSTTIFLGGAIDEHSDFIKIRYNPEHEITFDLGQISIINSVGIREWIKWMNRSEHKNPFKFKRCNRGIVDQINIVAGFLPADSIIESVEVPYFCTECDISESIYLETWPTPPSLPLTPEKCKTCGKPMDIDVLEKSYFGFLKKIKP